jgi:hypothetical protein
MTVYELTRTPEFQELLPKMAAFTMAYVQGFLDTKKFDRVAATQFSYKTKSAESARVLSYQLVKHPKVKKAVRRFLAPKAA